jgi:hypothetical protein
MEPISPSYAHRTHILQRIRVAKYFQYTPLPLKERTGTKGAPREAWGEKEGRNVRPPGDANERNEGAPLPSPGPPGRPETPSLNPRGSDSVRSGLVATMQSILPWNGKY